MATSKSNSKAPWDRENPKEESGAKKKSLSPSQKASAKKHAKAAGRPYPNLVDNMREARKSGTSKRK
jgi:hypothetical protein